ncbi:glycosyltransferase family 1 protein [Desulfopila sp. IMCC35006]|uniref:glycosyltransferase family 1 protein n=1 Tax=Desulfopila sp. IMCC35006 TaxID=2569542 RepID=UPI0010AB8ECD|nr:glycosyltransferase family 1 protein [Desulfopila sp. IMCC35006]TKB26126.1 glycosyltransferase family 1 protein [Desulfopila sp. IMCC35006]
MRLVYFSPVPWESFAQRPHKFVEWWLHASRGGEVLWVDPYPTRLPELADFRRIKVVEGSTTKLAVKVNTPAWLTVLHPNSLPIEPLSGAGWINAQLWKNIFQSIKAFVEKGGCKFAIGKPSKLALQTLRRHPLVPSLYDAMDDFSAFYRGLSRIAMSRREREVSERVTRISVSSTILAERFGAYHSKLALALNACAIETLPPPKAITKNSGKLVLGYVGTIGHWFDWPLVFDLAKANPSMCIRLIGPTYSSPPEPLPRNIELLPACDHAKAMNYMQEFSVGLIPFKRTDLTASVDPIKYYEYRALGLPVISTSFGEMALRGRQTGVFLTNKYSDLAKLVEKAIAFECEVDEIQEFRTLNSWEARFNASGILPC